MDKKSTVLMILDGFGINDRQEGNAVKLADTPNLDKIMKKYPWVKGYASGLDVLVFLKVKWEILKLDTLTWEQEE